MSNFQAICDSYLVLKPLKVELRRNFLATNSRLLTKVKNFSHDQLFIQESYFRPTTAIHDVVVPSLECLLLHKMMIDFDAFVSSGTTQGKSLGNRKVLLSYRVTLFCRPTCIFDIHFFLQNLFCPS